MSATSIESINDSTDTLVREIRALITLTDRVHDQRTLALHCLESALECDPRDRWYYLRAACGNLQTIERLLTADTIEG